MFIFSSIIDFAKLNFDRSFMLACIMAVTLSKLDSASQAKR